MFTKYNIPSDLLAYDGPIDKDSSEKIAAVKRHVQSIQDMIASIKVLCCIRSNPTLPYLTLAVACPT